MTFDLFPGFKTPPNDGEPPKTRPALTVQPEPMEHEDSNVYYDEDGNEDYWCDTCSNTGMLNCHCGGDLCICMNHGEYPCPDCV